MRVTAFILSLLLCAAAGAAVYKQVLPDGRIVYTDRPAEGAEEVKVGPIQTYSAPPVPADALKADGADPQAAPEYTEFAVTSPANDEVLRDNVGIVRISLQLAPGLKPGHKINIMMDGKTLGEGGKSTSLSLQNVDRGTHTVAAAVVDKSGKEIKRTEVVTFHLKRFHK
ncbi:MAG: penicillin-binding protein [Gammaproteobacteria bacterium]|nr:MAG: penicillin-binding protein [Gammaproteobacteria bacterium]